MLKKLKIKFLIATIITLIIVIGVALETIRELEAQMTMRNYKGFLD